MDRCLVKCGWHLGDILTQFPALKYLSKRYEVFAQVEGKYESIFELIDYAKVNHGGFEGRYYDLQIFGNDQRIQDCYGRFNHVIPVLVPYLLYPDLTPAMDEPIVFDRWPDKPDMPNDYFLIAPFGYSQKYLPGLDWMVKKAVEMWGVSLDRIYILNDSPIIDCPFPVITAGNLSHLAGIICHAAEFFTINSAPTYIASVVRENYYHLHDPEGYDWRAENKILVYHEGWPK